MADSFLSTATRWLERNGELFVTVESFGVPDCLFVHSLGYLQEFILSLPAYAGLTIYKDKQLPVRGCAGPELLPQALALVPDFEEWFMLSCKDCTRPAIEEDRRRYFWWMNSSERSRLELCRLEHGFGTSIRDALAQERGRYVAFGLDWVTFDWTDEVKQISARALDLKYAC